MSNEEFKEWCFEHKSSCFESNIKNKFPGIYLEIISFTNFPNNFKFSQKLYHYLNDDPELKLGVCPICGNRCRFKTIFSGYLLGCSKKCSNLIKSKNVIKAKSLRTKEEKKRKL